MSKSQPAPLDEAVIADLSLAAAAGDQTALERLIWHYHDQFLGHAARKIGMDWRGKIDAEDILQEAYADIFEGIADFKPGGQDAFYHWAARIISNRFIDHVRYLRRKKRDAGREVAQPAVQNSVFQPILDLCAGDADRPSATLRRDDAIRAIMTGLCRLPADYREVIQALYLHQESLAAVAARLGRSEDAVRRLAGRALEQLRDHLGSASLYLSTAR